MCHPVPLCRNVAIGYLAKDNTLSDLRHISARRGIPERGDTHHSWEGECDRAATKCDGVWSRVLCWYRVAAKILFVAA